MLDSSGNFHEAQAERIYHTGLLQQKIDHMLELSYYEKLRVHNLKYYTWIEQQQKELKNLNAQWYDKEYWKNIQGLTDKIDEQIEAFNKETGLE